MPPLPDNPDAGPPAATPRPTLQFVDSLDDPRVAVYRNLKDGDVARQGERFIAEGLFVVRRLLASDTPVESVLLARGREDEIVPLLRPGMSAYVASEQAVNAIVGFQFHTGVIACGRRAPAVRLDDVAARWRDPVTVVVLPAITSPANLGALLRICAAFGVAAVVLGPRCCDPFYRQAIRVSMGEVFKLPLVRSVDLPADLEALRGRHGVHLAGAVLDASAEPLACAARPERLGLLFGNEAQGLGPEDLRACQRRLTLPMHGGTDSLNVATAAAVFLYHFTHVARPGAGGGP